MDSSRNDTITILRYVLKRIIPVVLPVLLIAFYVTYEFTYRTIHNQQNKAIEAELTYAQEKLNSRILTTQRWLHNLSENGMIVNALVDSVGAREYIPQLVKTLRVPGSKGVGAIELIDFKGDLLASNYVTANTALSTDRGWLAQVLAGERYEAINYLGLVMAEPIFINGLPEGALVLIMDAPALFDYLDVTSISGVLSILDEQNRFLFSSAGTSDDVLGDIYSDTDLIDWVVSKKPLNGDSGLFVVLKQQDSVAFQAVQDVQYALFVFVIISLLGILLSLSISGRLVAKVLNSVSMKMHDLKVDKDLAKRIEVSPIQELAGLEKAYNELADDLQNTSVSKEYIDTLFEALPLQVLVVGLDGSITKTNQVAYESFADKETQSLVLIQDFFVQDDIEKHATFLKNEHSFLAAHEIDAFFYLARKQGRHEIEMRLNTSAGVRPFIISITALKGYLEGVIGYVITTTDIQDRKQKEREILELAEQNTLMARAIEEIQLGITISDGSQLHNPIIFCNQAFIDLSGRSMEEILGFSCDFMQGPETHLGTVKKLSDAIKARQSITVEILNYHKDGSPFWNELSLNPIFSSDGKLKNYVGIQNDISERKRIEAMKKDFVSTVSHELRTPLTSIHGSLGLMQDMFMEDMGDQEQELIQVAYRNSERLKALVDDILDTEKLDSGQMRFRMDVYALPDVIEQGVELNKPYGERYGVNYRVTGNIPKIQVRLDKDRMIQVFANLLSNAAKFSNGSDHVDVSAEISEDDEYVRISVRDYGEGISKEFQKHIFNRFAQQDSSDTRKLPGTGLGLFISRQIVEAHGGTIDFETEAGEGTVFFFDLPLSVFGENDDKAVADHTHH